MQLPGVLAEIAQIAGEPAAVTIAAARGGTRIYIPAKVTDDHWLVECVGRAKADLLCKHFSADERGIRIDIPLGDAGVYPQLGRRIARLIHELDRKGGSEREIAAQVRVHCRTVRRHRSRHRGGPKNGRQGSLF